ncbi:hypothetical protein HNQ60_004237 [Povalibacter uvarum]|uniref:DUF4168 domain-containing protein n=1 Tax=Povalibacter uvarum TaxID=732238 RepID=A0A841HQ62_9GAMM|nr:DUF4168 domain-containing protein [Povalibacter uvarum]MBB6095347.1 hypothetical protein [Povalibacter uvarum]
MTLIIRTACAALTAGTLLAIAPSLRAQTPDQAPPPAEMPVPQTDSAPSAAIAEEKVDQFAAAFVEVQKIQAQATQQLTSTTDEQQATAVKATAEKKMIEAVEREGLQVEEFNRIADLITTDMSLRARVVEKVQKRAKG